MYSYENISPATDWMLLWATFRRIRRTRNIHLHLNDSECGKNPCRCHLYWAKIQCSDEVWRREEKRRMRKKECSIEHFSSGPEFRNSIDPFPPLPSLGPWILLVLTPKLIQHLKCNQVPHSWFISQLGSYLDVVLIWNHQGGGASAHDYASMGAAAAGIICSHW